MQNMPTLEEEFKATVKKRRFRHLKALKADIVKAYKTEPAIVIVSSIFLLCLVGIVTFELGLLLKVR